MCQIYKKHVYLLVAAIRMQKYPMLQSKSHKIWTRVWCVLFPSVAHFTNMN